MEEIILEGMEGLWPWFAWGALIGGSILVVSLISSWDGEPSPKRALQNNPQELIESSSWNLDAVLQLTPEKFEWLVSELWEAMGYATETTQLSRDGGVDVIAYRNDPYEERVFIQAKRLAPGNKIGVREVREYAALRQIKNVDAVVIVTTSSFTSDALREAKELRVKTVEGMTLLGLLDKHKPRAKLYTKSAAFNSHEQAAYLALTQTLGFGKHEARRALENVRQEGDSTEKLTKKALAHLSSSKEKRRIQ